MSCDVVLGRVFSTSISTYPSRCWLTVLLGLAAVATTTHADVVYSGANRNVTYSDLSNPNTFSLFNAAGTWDDIRLYSVAMDMGGGDGLYEFIGMLNGHGNYISFAEGTTSGTIKLLTLGATVDGSGTYPTDSYQEFTSINRFSNFDSQHAEFGNGTGYAGFKMLNGVDTYYGWMKVTIANNNNANLQGTLVDWAYEDSPGVAITVGTIPEPSSILMTSAGLLALYGLARRARKASGKTNGQK